MPNGADACDYALLAERVRQRREELGLSLQDLAEATGLTRQTVARIERGHRCQPQTLAKLRNRLKLFSDQLIQRPTESPFFSVHRLPQTRWLVSLPKSSYSKVEAHEDPSHLDDEAERHRLGRLGFQPFFTAILQSELPRGVGGQAMMELHQSSWEDSHYGEEFIYCLRGSVRITVGGDDCVLQAGESMTFDAWTPHRYAPATPVLEGQLAPQILIVVIARAEDQSRRRAHFVEHPRRPEDVK